MARKNLLKDLMAPPPEGTALPAGNPDSRQPPDGPLPAGNAPAPRRTGALGAVGRSFAKMRENAVLDIPADMIDGAGLTDRLGDDPEHDRLVESLRAYGQQVPVLVRHSPNTEGRYEIVYGRRRVAALRHLRQPVRAMVRDLPDRALIVAQGQENTARVDLSWIERANFARQMAAMGFETSVICDALSTEKTAVSKMLKVAEALPAALIAAIGPAPGTGRDRWLALAKALTDAETARSAAAAAGTDSDARFEAALESQRAPAVPAPKPRTESHRWGRVSRGVRGTTLQLGTSGFGDWLTAHLDELHARWAEETGATTEEDKARK